MKSLLIAALLAVSILAPIVTPAPVVAGPKPCSNGCD